MFNTIHGTPVSFPPFWVPIYVLSMFPFSCPPSVNVLPEPSYVQEPTSSVLP